MTDRQAWQKIGRSFEAGKEPNGLCWALRRLLWNHRISYPQYRRMVEQLVSTRPRSRLTPDGMPWAFWWPLTRRAHFERATLAYLLAEAP